MLIKVTSITNIMGGKSIPIDIINLLEIIHIYFQHSHKSTESTLGEGVNPVVAIRF